MSKSATSIYITKDGHKWHAAALRAIMDNLPAGAYEVKIMPMGRKTPKQNRGIHQLYTIIAGILNREGYGDGRPYTKERVKALCKAEGLYPVEDMVKPGGEIIQVPKSTADLTDAEASVVIENVYAYFGDMGIDLPALGEQVKLDLAA